MKYSKQSINDLRSMADPVTILSSVGGVPISDMLVSSDEIRCACPLHGGDNRTGFSWKKLTGTWQCFTRGCGGTERSHDAFTFVMMKRGLSFADAVSLLSELFHFPMTQEEGEDYYSPDSQLAVNSIQDYHKSSRYKITALKELSFLPWFDKGLYTKALDYLTSRGYALDSLREFKLYGAKDPFGIPRLGIPAYDDTGKLVGSSARLMDTILSYPETILGEDGKQYPVPKYRMTKFNKGSILYNLNNAKKNSAQDGIVVVEGQFDVFRLTTYGILNAVACMGTILTPQQVSLLYKHCFSVTFLVEEGEAALEGVLKSVRHFPGGMRLRVAQLPSGDADSNSKEVVLKTLVEARTLTERQITKIKESNLL